MDTPPGDLPAECLLDCFTSDNTLMSPHTRCPTLELFSTDFAFENNLCMYDLVCLTTQPSPWRFHFPPPTPPTKKNGPRHHDLQHVICTQFIMNQWNSIITPWAASCRTVYFSRLAPRFPSELGERWQLDMLLSSDNKLLDSLFINQPIGTIKGPTPKSLKEARSVFYSHIIQKIPSNLSPSKSISSDPRLPYLQEIQRSTALSGPPC